MIHFQAIERRVKTVEGEATTGTEEMEVVTRCNAVFGMYVGGMFVRHQTSYFTFTLHRVS